MSSVSIGDRGTDSDALWNPHSILFAAAKNLLAFPVTVAQVSSPDPSNPWQWGDTIFQGAYVYNISLEGGIQFKGAITHKSAGQDIWSTWGDEINRILYIGSDLYTLSDTQLKVNDLATLADIATLGLPQPPPPPDYFIPLEPGPVILPVISVSTTNATIFLTH